ncbi:hypothetical protein PN498_17420 [Oscillatoria sp. CS-180]|uniref:hypothetical protein n=1 Tax=Oscillatoria sp. CS-180 TaxID=3021720 RepID=UPI00232E6CCA|nr:hypothetical protein [Oscillatoria sp. CS-180]MDB9527779.1 hypothetical protein [Oscillatoria sp. CS-180]
METLLVLGLAIAYGAGAWRFWKGFHRTNFSSNKISLTLLWPIYLIANKSYRENFNRALKG